MKKFNKTLAIAAIAAASMFSVQTASATTVKDPYLQECWEMLLFYNIERCPTWLEEDWKISYKLMIERVRDENIKITKEMADYLLEWGWLADYSREQVISYIGTEYEG